MHIFTGVGKDKADCFLYDTLGCKQLSVDEIEAVLGRHELGTL